MNRTIDANRSYSELSFQMSKVISKDDQEQNYFKLLLSKAVKSFQFLNN